MGGIQLGLGFAVSVRVRAWLKTRVWLGVTVRDSIRMLVMFRVRVLVAVGVGLG